MNGVRQAHTSQERIMVKVVLHVPRARQHNTRQWLAMQGGRIGSVVPAPSSRVQRASNVLAVDMDPLVAVRRVREIHTATAFRDAVHAPHVILDSTSRRLAMQVARIEFAPRVRPHMDLVFGRVRRVPPPPTAYAQLVSNARLGRP